MLTLTLTPTLTLALTLTPTPTLTLTLTLRLGQIDFASTQHKTQDASAELSDEPASQAAAAAVAELLGCTLDELSRALCTKVIMGGEVARTPREADVARHTLAKATY